MNYRTFSGVLNSNEGSIDKWLFVDGRHCAIEVATWKADDEEDCDDRPVRCNNTVCRAPYNTASRALSLLKVEGTQHVVVVWWGAFLSDCPIERESPFDGDAAVALIAAAVAVVSL